MESVMFSEIRTHFSWQNHADCSVNYWASIGYKSRTSSLVDTIGMALSILNSTGSRKLNSKLLGNDIEVSTDEERKQCCLNEQYVRICSEYNYLILRSIKSFKTILIKSDLHDLIQEGFLVLCETLETIDTTKPERFEEVANQNIQSRLKSLRREQFSTRKIFTEAVRQGVNLVQKPLICDKEIDEARLLLIKGIQALSTKQRIVIYRLYGFHGEPETMQVIAREIQVSYESVRRLHKRALSKLSRILDLQMLGY
jgi:RNA polymerase sigma factor (sigma-70 family)